MRRLCGDRAEIVRKLCGDCEEIVRKLCGGGGEIVRRWCSECAAWRASVIALDRGSA